MAHSLAHRVDVICREIQSTVWPRFSEKYNLCLVGLVALPLLHDANSADVFSILAQAPQLDP